MARVELSELHLVFRMTRDGPARFRDWLCARIGLGRVAPVREIHALRGVALSLGEGDRVGLVGPNGAGKSTLLKVIADVYPPTCGQRRVEGRIGALFDLMLGFESYATGWENIRLRSYLQGDTRHGVRRRMRAIAEFSGLGEHLDLPVARYSNGMKARLAFSIATAIEPEILLVDEAITAGDAAFREQALARMRSLMRSSAIVVVASHDRAFLQQICTRVIWMEHGAIRQAGPPGEVLPACEAAMLQQSSRVHGPRARAA